MRIGYVGEQSKWKSVKWDEFIKLAKENDIEVKYIDINQNFEEQGIFDIIIYKVTYLLESPIPEENKKIANLYNYIKNHPEVIIIDDLKSVCMTLDRAMSDEAMRSISWPGELDVRVPKSVLLNKSDLESIKIATKDFNFPVISKPNISCKTFSAPNELAHTLHIATNQESLIGIITPSIVQEYINHGGVVYKIYAIGDSIHVTTRPSTKDIKKDESISLDFHSQKADNSEIWSNIGIHVDNSHNEVFRKISKIIRKSLNMNLIGFDIITDKNGVFWLIDINYFPGYSYIDDLPQRFLNFFVSLYNHTLE